MISQKIKEILKINYSNDLNTTHSVDEKGDNELDFWINVWNKNIINRTLSKNKLKKSQGRQFEKLYHQERIIEANSQLSGILSMAKKPKKYLDNKTVVEIGPGCCCALEVSNAKVKIAIEPLAERYRNNNLLLDDNFTVTYLNMGSEKIPLFSNYADVVIASNCLDHVENITDSINEIYRILKPGGELFLNIEIDHAPTVCEPFSLKYSDLKHLFRDFETEFIFKMNYEINRVCARAVYRKPLSHDK